MSDQLLQRARVTVNQRADVVDFSRTNDLAAANLALALRYLVAPGLGVVRGLLLEATDPASMFCTLKPGSAIGQNGGSSGLIIVESDRSVGPFSANSSGNPRIDLVSIRYAEADQSPGEPRLFVNPADNSSFPSTVATLVLANPEVLITEGSPASNPSAPATPSGYLPIARVRVESGVTSIAADKITTVRSGRVDPIQFATHAGDANIALPYQTPTLLSLDTPSAHLTVLLGRFTLNASLINPAAPYNYRAYIYDVSLGNIVASAIGVPPAQELYTYTCIGVVRGATNGARDYQLRFARTDAGSVNTIWSAADFLLVAVTLPGL